MDDIVKHTKAFLHCYAESYGKDKPDYNRCARGEMVSLWNSKQCPNYNGFGPHKAYCRQHDPFAHAPKNAAGDQPVFTYDDLVKAYYLGTLAKHKRETASLWSSERDKALKSIVKTPPAAKAGKRIRHIKSGGFYRMLGRAQLQTSSVLSDYADMVVYQSEDSGYIWVRPLQEFQDGRFEEVSK